VHKGAVGNDLDVRLNYGGRAAGEATPAGLAVTITAMHGGAVNPSLSAALAALGDMPFDFIALPYTDSTSLNALRDFLSDTNGRWGYLKQIYGHAITAKAGTYGELVTFGTGRNGPHETAMGVHDSPTPAYLWAAAVTGACAAALRVDPALTVQTVPVLGVQAPPLQSRFDTPTRNTLLYDGISTFMVGDDGSVYLENVITTYQKNVFGSPDNAFLQIETLSTLTYVLRGLRTLVTTKYARVKLADNGARLAAGTGVVTPNVIKADLIAKSREYEQLGYLTNVDAMVDELIVEINTSKNGVAVLYPPHLMQSMRIFALLAQFRLG